MGPLASGETSVPVRPIVSISGLPAYVAGSPARRSASAVAWSRVKTAAACRRMSIRSSQRCGSLYSDFAVAMNTSGPPARAAIHRQ